MHLMPEAFLYDYEGVEGNQIPPQPELSSLALRGPAVQLGREFAEASGPNSWADLSAPLNLRMALDTSTTAEQLRLGVLRSDLPNGRRH